MGRFLQFNAIRLRRTLLKNFQTGEHQLYNKWKI